MSDFRFYLGDEEIAVERGEINMNQSVPALGDLEWKPVRSASASFELRDPNEEWVRALQVGDARTVQLTTTEVYEWSRWRRWLNAVLRFAWWPIGPPRLPEDFELTLLMDDMRIERVEFERGRPLRIDMSNRGGK